MLPFVQKPLALDENTIELSRIHHGHYKLANVLRSWIWIYVEVFQIHVKQLKWYVIYQRNQYYDVWQTKNCEPMDSFIVEHPNAEIA